VITGANTGIGKETAIDLAKRGGKIYIACRDIHRGQEAIKDIKEKSQNDNIHFLQLDLASLESIRDFSKQFHDLEPKLDILINNAGVMMTPQSTTKDGFELQFGTNHLGHFLLTNLLLDLLKCASPSRVVVVSAELHRITGINRDDLMLTSNYNSLKAYAQSKLANILFSNELAKRLEGTGVTVNSLHPGVVQSELGRHANPFLNKYIGKPIIFPLFKTTIDGAQTQIKLAVDPDLENVSGKYFSGGNLKTVSSNAQDEKTADWLWNQSCRLVGL
jgi:NAD(P)-dependent dehydrogenase (short-subunit alcohol dehydrogenase family)